MIPLGTLIKTQWASGVTVPAEATFCASLVISDATAKAKAAVYFGTGKEPEDVLVKVSQGQ